MSSELAARRRLAAVVVFFESQGWGGVVIVRSLKEHVCRRESWPACFRSFTCNHLPGGSRQRTTRYKSVKDRGVCGNSTWDIDDRSLNVRDARVHFLFSLPLPHYIRLSTNFAWPGIVCRMHTAHRRRNT